MTDDDLTRLRDEVAAVLHGLMCHLPHCNGPDEYDREDADALLPLLARKIAEARAAALREAADEVWRVAGVQWGRTDYRYFLNLRADRTDPARNPDRLDATERTTP